MGYKIPDDLPSELMVYGKMLKVGLSENSVLNKMAMDGVDEEKYYQYLDPNRKQEEAEEQQEEDEFASDDDQQEDNPLYAAQDAPAQPAQGGNDLLAIEQHKVDMSGMNPMPIKKTLILVNSFIADTVTFLNRFVGTCEDRLTQVDQRIEKMKLRMLILENNLNSIEWLRTEPENAAPAQQQQGEAAAQQGEQEEELEGKEGEEGQETGGAGPGPSLRDDPNLALYFKMLSVKVPPPAVRNKMIGDGIAMDIIEQVLAL